MKSIKKFENKKIQGLNENVLKGGIHHTGDWLRWDSDIAWNGLFNDEYHQVDIHIGLKRPKNNHFSN